MCCHSDICLLTVMLACFMEKKNRYLLVGKIAIMANADYVVDLKTDFKCSFLCFIPHEVAGYFLYFL